MDQILQALAMASSSSSSSSTTAAVLFGRVQAEQYPTISTQYQVTAVPTFVLINCEGQVVERIQGGEDVAQITQAVQRLLLASSPSSSVSRSHDTIAQPTTAATAVVDGGNDPAALHPHLDKLIHSAPVMIFLKGTPEHPRCGFSRQAVEILQQENIPFGSYDILSNETVRQGLKAYRNWPTYPQIYVHGELIGGLDILRELQQEATTEGSSLREQWKVGTASTTSTGSAISSSSPPTLQDRLKQIIHRSSIMLFMKGLPSQPRCGFSRQIVEILDAEQISYDAFDILQDEEIRQGLKTFSNWPTYPQLYVNGELVGGLDIVKELKEDGSLRDVLGVE